MELINEFSSLPGVSKKQAEKIAFFLVTSKHANSNDLSDAILNASQKIKRCQVCNHLTENDKCYICLDTTRNNVLVVVENSVDVFKFDETQDIKPYFHVLNGLINISKNIKFDDLNIDKLKSRAKDYKEVIIALSPNLEGIVTANYIKQLLRNQKVTQLAQGIPLGAAMEYVDELTLKASIENRKEIK
ncbi:recombination mediator RecR [Candidatus Mycoplasma mahonii]|uniref:recombination mediator RecR n=1 Tax=Candidatus Mycoplasma mahonii TaxID=3004105 RepID=UPI0026ECA21B|nr:recombination mediator RecR [Candidatus Mycoplasma mahonii]WKX02606.1 recombination mediator RecR [Candidatus Mycoplasma mahonii]